MGSRPVAYARILKGGDQARSQKFEKRDKNQMRKIETKKKSFLLRFSLFFCPDLSEDQKKKIFTEIQSVFLPRFLAPSRKGGFHGSILRTILRYSYITGDPKGGTCTMSPPP